MKYFNVKNFVATKKKKFYKLTKNVYLTEYIGGHFMPQGNAREECRAIF